MGDVSPALTSPVTRSVGDQRYTIDVESRAAEARFVYADWDDRRSVEVPNVVNAKSGQVLSGKLKDVEIVHPVTKVVYKQESYTIRDPMTVVDLRGGRLLGMANRSRDPMYSPAEALVYDPTTGQLRLVDDIASFTDFRMYTFADENEAAAQQADGRGGRAGGLFDPGGGDEGMGGGPAR